jgi:hypothetical protein
MSIQLDIILASGLIKRLGERIETSNSPMLTCAIVCLEDAAACFQAGQYRNAEYWALRGFKYLRIQ